MSGGYVMACGTYVGSSELAAVQHMERCSTCAPTSDGSGS